MYGAAPPPKVAVTLPSLPPLQLTSVFDRLSVTAAGWLTVIEADCGQPLASFTVTVCDTALRPLKVCGEGPAAANAPASILIMYGAVPPPKVAVTLPSAPPLQLTSVLVRLSVTAAGWLTVIEADCGQPFASFTVTVCDPAIRLLKVCGEGPAATNAPASILIIYGAAPPPKVAVTEPVESPLQLTSVLVRLSVTAVGWLTVIEPDSVQPFASFTVTVCDPAL